MIRLLLLIGFFVITLRPVSGQSDCNHLGVWLWHLEQTGFFTHGHLATNLAQLGVSRIYVKVADGRVDTVRWPELTDRDLIKAYQDEGLEVWAWSYNYTENDSLQAEALYMAAQTGYDGYVVDVETEFNGKPLALHNLFFAFSSARRRAIADDIAIDTFNLYCTTWGNPKTHNYPISVIDPWVDGYMPQTYVELWSFADLDDIPFWIEKGNKEYEELGATKPIHHLCTTQVGIMTQEQINTFITASGPETSLWRVPGGGVPLSVWEDWRGVDWEQDFCGEVSSSVELSEREFTIYPNPTSGPLHIATTDYSSEILINVYDLSGNKVISEITAVDVIDLSYLPQGFYVLEVLIEDEIHRYKVSKV